MKRVGREIIFVLHYYVASANFKLVMGRRVFAAISAQALVTQRVSNSRVRDRLGFRQSGSGLGSVCILASGSARFGFFVGFLYLDLSKISSRVWFGFMLKIRVRVSVCKK